MALFKLRGRFHSWTFRDFLKEPVKIGRLLWLFFKSSNFLFSIKGAACLDHCSWWEEIKEVSCSSQALENSLIMVKNKNGELFCFVVFKLHFRMWVTHINSDSCMERSMPLLWSLLKAQGSLRASRISRICRRAVESSTVRAIENSSVLMSEELRLMSVSGIIKNHKVCIWWFLKR